MLQINLRVSYSFLIALALGGIILLTGCEAKRQMVVMRPTYSVTQPRIELQWHDYTNRRPQMGRYIAPEPIPKLATRRETTPIVGMDTLPKVASAPATATYVPVYAGMAEASAANTGSATDAPDDRSFYAAIQAEFADDPSDSEKMKAFKALKDSLDIALTASGMTPDEIKRFYILNYLSRGPAPTRVSEQGQSGSHQALDTLTSQAMLLVGCRKGTRLS
jgi:hypothetical protein